jgi:truncated hemoglobin YjbI
VTAGPFEYRGAVAGLTEPLIRTVILSFYEKVRRDLVLEPVFAEAIGDDWTPHIERIVLFWLTATGLQRGYEGRNFMPAHLRPFRPRQAITALARTVPSDNQRALHPRTCARLSRHR